VKHHIAKKYPFKKIEARGYVKNILKEFLHYYYIKQHSTMASTDIVNPFTFDASKVVIGDARALDGGRKIVPLYYGKNMLKFQTAEMAIPYSISDYNGDGRFKINLSFKNMETDPKIAKFKEMLEGLGNVIIQKGVEKSKKWFKGNFNENIIPEFYKSPIHYAMEKDKDGNKTGNINTQYAPTFSILLPKVDGKYNFPTYDGNRQLIDLDKIQAKGAQAMAIIQCNGIYLADRAFGPILRVKQLLVKAPTRKPRIENYVFKDDVDRMVNEGEQCAFAEDAQDEDGNIFPSVEYDEEDAVKSDGDEKKT